MINAMRVSKFDCLGGLLFFNLPLWNTQGFVEAGVAERRAIPVNELQWYCLDLA
jgi:hypothetical protein